MADSIGLTVGEELAPTTNQEISYSVQINKAENGFIVNVGCKVFVFSTWEEAGEGIGLYFKDPKKAKEKYCSK